MYEFPETMPWYKSRVILGLLVSVTFKILVAVGMVEQIAPEDEAAWLEIALLLASFGGDALAGHARFTQKAAPILTVRPQKGEK